REHGPPLDLRLRGLEVEQVVVSPGRVEAQAIGLEPGLPHLGVRPVHLGDLEAEAEPSRDHGTSDARDATPGAGGGQRRYGAGAPGTPGRAGPTRAAAPPAPGA